jgi:hypothetical protein
MICKEDKEIMDGLYFQKPLMSSVQTEKGANEDFTSKEREKQGISQSCLISGS